MKNIRILPDEHRDDKTAPGLLSISHGYGYATMMRYSSLFHAAAIAPDAT